MSSKDRETTLRELLEQQYGPGVVETLPFAEGVDPDGTIIMPNLQTSEEWKENFLKSGTPPWSAA